MKKIIVFLILTFFLHVIALNGILTASDEEDHGGDIIYTKPVKAVLFSHEYHVEEAGLDCDSCHDEIFPMEAAESQENDDFTMESLYDGKYCGACHDGDMAFASDTQCASCHIGVKGYKRLLNEGDESDSGEKGH